MAAAGTAPVPSAVPMTGAPAAVAIAHAEQSDKRRRWQLVFGGLGLLFLAWCGIFPIFSLPGPAEQATVLVAALLPALVYGFIVISLDKNEIEPWRVLLAAFLWGALISTLVAGIVNSIATATYGNYLGTALGAPLSEETSKGIVLLILFFYLRKEFDNVLDGLVYGAMVGIGFAMVENIQYFTEAYTKGGTAGLIENFYLRAIVGGWGHAAYTATTGAALGYARETQATWKKLVAPVIGWFCAVFQHAAWNGIAVYVLGVSLALAGDQEGLDAPSLFLGPLIKAIFLGPGIVVLIILMRLAWKREAQVITDHLADEVRAGWITQEEYDRLRSADRRRKLEWRVFRTHGRKAWHAMLDVDQAITDLAFRKWHLSRGEQPKRHQKELTDDQLRQEIGVLRQRFTDAVGGAPVTQLSVA